MAHLLTIIPVYNGGSFLQLTLEALARQSRRPDRVIVLDDCSTDGTERLTKEFKGLPCEHVRNEKNLGLFPNHNRALSYADQTDYLHILHANDLILPEFNARLLEALENKSGRGLAYCFYESIDTEGRRLGQAPAERESPRDVSKPDFLKAQSELKPLLIDAVILKTQRRPSPCLFRLDFPHLGDCVFHAEFANACEHLVEVPKVLCQFRRHSGATRTNMDSLKSWVIDEWRAMDLICQMMDKSGEDTRLHRAKLRVLFASRSYVKIQMTRRLNPEYARRIKQISVQTVGASVWRMGLTAVWLRDALYAILRKPKPWLPAVESAPKQTH